VLVGVPYTITNRAEQLPRKGGLSLKATGIVRRIDDLGRVVIPKEIRRTLRIREGDPLEIFVDRDGEVILKKYSPIGELGDFAKEYADSLYEAVGHIALIADRDTVIAVAGAPKKEFMNKAIGPLVERIMEERRTVLINKPAESKQYRGALIGDEEEETRFTAEVVAPIVAGGDPIGAVILCTKEPDVTMGDLEVKLAETAAGFLAKQMEQ
jgi:AbrB family transcriptional regulator (stage V sporulation protein T)